MTTIAYETRAAIDALITDFFWRLDHDDTDAIGDLFTDDAWIEMGVADRPRVHGPEGAAALFGVRPPGRVVRHHWLGLKVHEAGADVRTSFQFATYVGASGPPAPPQAVVAGEVDADFRQGADGVWRFTKMDRRIVFSG